MTSPGATKVVNGAPLRRPPWYYDVGVQGDGLVDVHSHLVDQARLLALPSPRGRTLVTNIIYFEVYNQRCISYM